MSFDSVTGYMTGGLIDPSSPNYLGAASKANRKMQAQIDQGMQALNATYFGGQYPRYSQAAGPYNPNQQYFTLNRQGAYVPYKPKGKGAKSGGVSGGLTGSLIGGAIGSGVGGPVGGAIGGGLGGLFGSGLFGGGTYKGPGWYMRHNKLFANTPSEYQKGFGSDFYSGIANDYIQAALPQLAQQQKDASDSIKFGLFNRGLGKGSSAYGTAMSDLNVATGKAEQDVANNALSAARSTQNQVMNAYQNAVSSLYNTTNPSQAAQSGVATAAQFNVPQTFTPISNMFSDLANNYATRMLYNSGSSGGGAGFVTPYMNTSGGSSFLGPTTY